ncbi:MAG: adenosylmethionine decarboxylase [Nanoarchaeota archaeon]
MEKKGIHILANFYGCKNKDLLVNEPKLSKTMTDAVMKNHLTILKSTFHKFDEGGITGFLLLSESHVSIHTWPEKDNYLALDIFVCNLEKDNTKNAKNIYKELVKAFNPEKKEEKFIERD